MPKPEKKDSMYGQASKLWSDYRDESAVFRGEQYAKFTIPSLMVDPLERLKGEDARRIEHDFQSVGAFLVNNLASKIVTALFPANMPYFKLEMSNELQNQAREKGIDEAALQGILSTWERDSTKQVFLHGGQHKLIRAIKLLITVGDCLVYRDADTQKFMVWTRQSFSVRRTPLGDLACAVLKQRFRFDELDEDIQKSCQAIPGKVYKDDQEVDLYTVIKTIPGKPNSRVKVWHEIDQNQVGSVSTYPQHLSPYLVPVWNLADGENYGRGLVEEYSGDFARLSLVTEQLGLYELDALNILNLVDEAAGGVVDDYQNADTGDYVPGKTGAVTAYERGDYNKMTAINASLSALIQRLSQAFMYTGQMRDAERVTATEVRRVARETEITLGGVYSLLAESLQAPLAYLSMTEVADQSGNENMLFGIVARDYKPVITTGIPAMTRSQDTENLLMAAQEAGAIVPALQQISRRFDTEKVVEKIFQGNSVNLEEISKSPEQMAEEARAQQEQAAAAQQMTNAAAAGQVTEIQDAIQGIQ